MSILQSALPGASVLDLFCGSGALGLEALSRGARHATFVESGAPALRVLRENIVRLGATAVTTVHHADALHFADALAPEAYDVVFADPPYRQGLAVRLADRWRAEPFSRILAIEHAADEPVPEGDDRRRYGATALTFYGG